MFANYVNEKKLDLKFKWLSSGRYLIGSQKVFMKIINSRLIVRIGGGYTSVEKFMAQFDNRIIVSQTIKGLRTEAYFKD